jgi:glycosyltransferase involved in cell wall biosynthesis
MKLTSVVIPTYNCAKYVCKAIGSVLHQSYGNVEIIVVDDGSTDETRDVIQPFKERIKYIYQENTGLPGARNRGIREASGEYVAFLDADDLWDERKLEIQVNVLDSFPSTGIVFSDFSVFDESGYAEYSYFRKCFPIFRENSFSLDEIFPAKTVLHPDFDGKPLLVYQGRIAKYLFCGNFVLPSSALVRRSVLDKVGLFDESYRIAEETDYFLRLCSNHAAAYVDRPLVDYLLKRTGNLTGNSNTERLIRNAIRIQEEYLSANPEVHASDRRFFDTAVAKSYARLSYYLLSVTRNTEARSEAKQSVAWNPLQTRAYSYWLLGLLPGKVLAVGGKLKRLL